MTVANPLSKVVDWLRAGYPAEAPCRGYLPLIALCGPPQNSLVIPAQLHCDTVSPS
jgi:hypothetical protein